MYTRSKQTSVFYVGEKQNMKQWTFCSQSAFSDPQCTCTGKSLFLVQYLSFFIKY